MLADNRETHVLIEKGVNALNVRGERFDAELMELSFKIIKLRNFLNTLTKDELKAPETSSVIQK